MSLYRQGIMGSIGGDVGGDPLVWTPGLIRSELDRIRLFLDAVNLDVSAGAAVQPPTISNTEWNEWSAFYQTAHKYIDGASTLWGGSVTQARQYEVDAGKWRTLLSSRGGKTTGPSTQRNPDDTATPTPGWLYPALGIGGVLAVATLVKSIKH